jgi:predicted aspartyl protease
LLPNRQAWVKLRLLAGVEVEVLIDTGFEGGLVLPESLVYELGLPIIGHEVFGMVGDVTGEGSLAECEVEWLGQVQTVEIVTSEDYLLGTDLLADAVLNIDYKHGRFTIERLP